MRKHLLITIVLVLALSLIQSISYADRGHGYDRGRHQKKSVKEKFYKTVKMIYLYQDELKVNEKQLDQVKKLKINLKKDLIRKKADIKIIKVDIRSLLHEDKVDIEAVNKLINQKYEIKKAKMKMVVKSYAELKRILTKEQLEQLKDIIRDQKKMMVRKL